MSPIRQHRETDCRLPAPVVAKLYGIVLVACFTLAGCHLPSITFNSTAKSSIETQAVVATEFESFRETVFFDRTVAIDKPEVVSDTSSSVDSAASEALFPMDLGSIVRDSGNINYCRRIDKKLKSITLRNCLLKEALDSSFRSKQGEPIFYVQFEAKAEQNPLGRVLVLGGVHGDELTSVSTVYLWIAMLKEFHSGLFDWRLVPIVNPDGFFKLKPTRTNANGVDLNRNLPTYQWNQLADHYWKQRAGAAKRKYPGPLAASESESKWLINEIKTYKPDVIVTVHAPYNLVDYDASDRSSAPRQLGMLTGKSLGTYPGSLGRYAGEERNIPVITLELPHSSHMPPLSATNEIWLDLVGWMRQHIDTHNIAGRSFNHCNRSPSASGCI